MGSSLKGHGNETDFFIFLYINRLGPWLKGTMRKRGVGNVLSQIVHCIKATLPSPHYRRCGSRFSIMNISANSKPKLQGLWWRLFSNRCMEKNLKIGLIAMSLQVRVK
jgi:hypothetical protein